MVSKATCCGILQKSAPCFHATKATKQWTLVEIELLATMGSKWGGQPFSCPCSQKSNALPKKDLLDMFVSGIHSCSLCFAKTFNSWTDQRVRKGEILSWDLQSSSNIVVSEVCYGWKWGCQPFSCQCSLTHCWKEIFRCVCLGNPF